jgi:hypothetical protein
MLTKPVLLALFTYTTSAIAAPPNLVAPSLGTGNSCTGKEENNRCKVPLLGINGICRTIGVRQKLPVDLLRRDIG